MEGYKRKLYYFFGRVYIPENIINCNEDILLHISDTPFNFYSALKKLVKDLNPKYIIHTGDMVDDVKLELYSWKLEEYERKIKVLINILENSSADKIYLVLGNHDNSRLVRDYAKKSIVIEKSCIIDIDGMDYKVSHLSEDIISKPAKYNLFGHDLSLSSKIENGGTYLNGITGIHIITLKSREIFTLPYPYGTNDDRMCKSNIGL